MYSLLVKMSGPVGALALGAGFGTLASLVNSLSSDYGVVGDWLRAGDWTAGAAGPIRVLSLILDSGWAWASLAVLAGLLVKTRLLAALDGLLVLAAATATYFCMDSILRSESLSGYGTEMVVWWTASVLLGPLLGMIGAHARTPGVTGLLAKLTVPVGAITQMIVLPPGWGGIEVKPSAVVARVLVSVVAIAVAVRVLSQAGRRRPGAFNTTGRGR